MARIMFVGLVNIRNVINVSNISAVGGTLHIRQHSDVTSKPATSIAIELSKLVDSDEAVKKEKKLNKAMKIYLQRCKDYRKFLEIEIIKYEIGKRHLANMMGEDPDKLTEKSIANAINYLFPSGLYDWRARPLISDPVKTFGQSKEAEFNDMGRPFHFFYYTCKKNYYEVLHNIANNMKILNEKEEQMWAQKKLPTSENKVDLLGTDWCAKNDVENIMNEELETNEYTYLIKSLERLAVHPMSKDNFDFIMKFRKPLKNIIGELTLPPIEYDSNGRPFIETNNCKRKSSRGNVKVIGKGSGNITINGHDITYFERILHREQIIFPLIFTNMQDKVDIEATVSGGGPTGQSGVVRLGIAKGLRNFVDIQMIEKMRLAGLLTTDPRKRERKKPGKEGARRRYTWKKR
ncbi:mitochondrial ribosomal protein S9 [Nomia melanderi]|uniref:mitochondrial ribosomal protein S9 n=1 Tax=Nomia melanderi TaxID=2448451 RepID=UPI003FCE81FF